MVETLDEHPWSSHPGYVSRAKKWDWLHKDFILAMLTPEKKKSKQAYLRFIAQDDTDEFLDLLERKKWPSLLGGEDFISWIKETFFEKKKHRQIQESVQLAPEQEDIIREVCRSYDIKEPVLLAAQRGKSNEPRNVAIYLCRVLGTWKKIILPPNFNFNS